MNRTPYGGRIHGNFHLFDLANSTLYIAETDEIKAMYKSIVRAGKKNRTNISPQYLTPARFNPDRQKYGLIIGEDNFMSVVNSDTALGIVIDSLRL